MNCFLFNDDFVFPLKIRRKSRSTIFLFLKFAFLIENNLTSNLSIIIDLFQKIIRLIDEKSQTHSLNFIFYMNSTSYMNTDDFFVSKIEITVRTRNVYVAKTETLRIICSHPYYSVLPP